MNTTFSRNWLSIFSLARSTISAAASSTFFRDAVEHGQLFLVHIVKGAVDFGKWYIVGWLCETDAFPEGYHLVVAAVQTKGDVVIDVFNDLHLPTTPHRKKKTEVHPYLQWIRESLRRVTNLT